MNHKTVTLLMPISGSVIAFATLTVVLTATV